MCAESDMAGKDFHFDFNFNRKVLESLSMDLILDTRFIELWNW